jgi:hypothetical protein
MYGSSLKALGSVGTAPATETCDWAKPSPGQVGKIDQVCSTTWSSSAAVQVRFEWDGRDDAWGIWSGVSKPVPAGYELTSIGGLPALVASADGDTVPGSDETVPGARRIIVWVAASQQRMWWSYRITAVLRGADIDGVQRQVQNMIDNIEFVPPVRPLATDPASAQAALTNGLLAVSAQAARSDGTMSADCFSNRAGVPTRARISAPVFLGYRLTRPLDVRCTSEIEPTAFQLWKLTLRYDWDAAKDHPSGTASLVLVLTDDGGFGGDSFGVDHVPGLIKIPANP